MHVNVRYAFKIHPMPRGILSSLYALTPMRSKLTHLVLAVAVADPALVLGLELVVDGDVQISPVLLVWSAAELASHVLASLDCKHVRKIEYSLLPVSVLCVGASAEADWLVASGKLDIEPSDESVDVVGSADGEVKWQAEGKIGNSAGVEVEGQYGAWVSHNGLELDSVDKRLGEGGELERCVVEPVDVFPDCPTLAT